ncbi:tetraspanin-9-like [Mytilus edulis]|uniref:Tetraspanin n=3 Tax=Mytilus TaxID=6548 RepID=A0A8B6F9D7_MYTGA|nr:TSPAN4 [Mytilus edulis]VDI46112.1 tetraspanin-4 [Mytilus galloprovincialis]
MNGIKCMKTTFAICNILFFIMGIAAMCIGIYLKVSRSDFVEILQSKEFETSSALLISAGIIVIVVALVGFIGAWMNNQCMLGLYFIFVIVIFAMELAAGIIAFIYRKDIEVVIRRELLEGVKKDETRSAWDKLQEKYLCCGVNNYTDWYGVYDIHNYNTLPDSCCGYTGCGQSGGVVAYRISCYEDAKEWIIDNFYLIGAAGVAIGVLQLLLVIVSLALICFIRKEKSYKDYRRRSAGNFGSGIQKL